MAVVFYIISVEDKIKAHERIFWKIKAKRRFRKARINKKKEEASGTHRNKKKTSKRKKENGR